VTVDRTEAGTTWRELARLDPLAAVLDPGDSLGAKNRALDRVHKYALAAALGEVEGRKVIDFGCGTGRLSGWLADRGATVDGVDVTVEMIEVARKRSFPRTTFTVIEDLRLPFADDTFDLGVSAYVLQYYLAEPAVAAEIARVLQPTGTLATVEQVTKSEIGRGGSIERYIDMFKAAGFATIETRAVRASDSKLIGAISRRPWIARVPLLPQLIEREATRLQNAPLTNGRYADVLFTCRVGSI
jgi:ubiquinone/menaquinone biosynthesis C-methylase UbiE